MAISFTHTIDVPVPVERVFRVVDDPARVPEWLARCVAMEQLTPGPVAVGTKLRYTYRDAGRQGVMDGEVVEREEGSKLVLRFADAQMVAVIGFRTEPSGSGCALTHSVDLEPRSLLPRLFAPLIRRQLPKQTTAAMEELRRLVLAAG